MDRQLSSSLALSMPLSLSIPLCHQLRFNSIAIEASTVEDHNHKENTIGLNYYNRTTSRTSLSLYLLPLGMPQGPFVLELSKKSKSYILAGGNVSATWATAWSATMANVTKTTTNRMIFWYPPDDDEEEDDAENGRRLSPILIVIYITSIIIVDGTNGAQSLTQSWGTRTQVIELHCTYHTTTGIAIRAPLSLHWSQRIKLANSSSSLSDLYNDALQPNHWSRNDTEDDDDHSTEIILLLYEGVTISHGHQIPPPLLLLMHFSIRCTFRSTTIDGIGLPLSNGPPLIGLWRMFTPYMSFHMSWSCLGPSNYNPTVGV